jgi:deoxyribodipyrimidine photo-lyase
VISVVWFKRDLRVHDHAALAAAAASGHPVLALYIVEPELWRQPALSGRQFAFLEECLDDLDRQLISCGGALVRRTGEAVSVLADLHARYGIAQIHGHEETGLEWTYARDKAVRRWAGQARVPLLEYRQHGVWRALKRRDGWAARWDQMMAAPVLPKPALKSALGLADDPCPGRQPGGRREGIAMLGSFLAQRGRTYRSAMSSPLEGADAYSRISAHLAFGCLSMREAHQAATRALLRWAEHSDAQWTGSIRSFISRLHWHCHFIQKLEGQPSIEHTNLHPAYADLRPVGPEHEALVAAWRQGQTGFPFVDACMRSLGATGWLNFRMRSMVMAFSSYHLWQDWRRPAQELARLFTDFEPGIHFPQAQMQSGTTGVNTARIYNPVKQSLDQDPDGLFIRRWLPELAAVPIEFLHEPWTAPDELLRSWGVEPGTTYPRPLVDHVTAARFARERIYTVRKGAGFRQTANGIQQRHGSRKAGLPPTARRRAARPAKSGGQGEFSF